MMKRASTHQHMPRSCALPCLGLTTVKAFPIVTKVSCMQGFIPKGTPLDVRPLPLPLYEGSSTVSKVKEKGNSHWLDINPRASRVQFFATINAPSRFPSTLTFIYGFCF